MIKKHTVSFKNAFSGLIWCLKTQPNYKIHIFLAILAVSAGYYLKITYFELLIIITLIIFGLVVESFNTAIEVTTDAIDKKWRADIKIAKDVSAAAMLIFAIGAFIIACIIFFPKILNFNF